MTVKELIEALEKEEDKDKRVILDVNLNNDLDIKDVYSDALFIHLKN